MADGTIILEEAWRPMLGKRVTLRDSSNCSIGEAEVVERGGRICFRLSVVEDDFERLMRDRPRGRR
jgi:hypothetical protein